MVSLLKNLVEIGKIGDPELVKNGFHDRQSSWQTFDQIRLARPGSDEINNADPS